MTTIKVQELGDGSVAIQPSGPAGATDAAKLLADQVGRLVRASNYIQPAIASIDRYGTTLDVRGPTGRRFVIIVAELPS